MTTTGEIPRVPDDDDKDRHRRAHDRLATIVNDLISDGVLVRDSGTGKFTITTSGTIVLATAVFGQKVDLAGLPHCENAFPVLASRVFADRVSYGTVG